MNITVNGKTHQVEDTTTISQLLDTLNLDQTRVAIERNFKVVTKDEYANTPLAEGDTLEIVQFVGGG